MIGASYARLRCMKNWSRDSHLREQRRLEASGAGALHQVSSRTRADRYPRIFAASRRLAPDRGGRPLRILSFGCSTGEEVFSLRSYFPAAHIVGIDINKECLKKCRRRNTDPRNEFLEPSKGLDGRDFDLVFCMAVLQRSPSRHARTENVSDVYPFEKFERELETLDRLIPSGGMLILYHTFYRFRDSRIAPSYTPCPVSIPDPVVPKFDRHGKRVEDEHYDEVLFRKL
jgi:hypothetical protein